MMISMPCLPHRMILVIVGIALLSTACSPLPSLPAQPQAMTLLTIDVPALLPVQMPSKESVLQFNHVEAVAALRNTHMLYRRRGPVMNRYAYHRWLVMPAELIDQAFMQSLAPQLPYTTVVRPEQGLVADYALSLVLLKLEQEFVSGDRSLEHLEMQAQLMDLDRHRVIASHLFSYREVAPKATAVGGAMAAGTALGRLFNDLQIWLSEVDH